MRRLVYILLAGFALIACSACSRGRIIPDGRLEDIYYEMFLADKWARNTPGMETKADTTFFYEPIFRKYGYSLKDYDRTVQKKLSDCEEYSKLVKRVSERLLAGADALDSLMARNEKARLAALKLVYYQQDFSFPVQYESDVYVNYFDLLKNKQYGFTGKIQLFPK